MKLSWSQKLFLKINKNVGKRPWLDQLMYFCGQWMIFVLVFFVAILALIFLRKQEYTFFIIGAGSIFLFGYALSYSIALLFRNPRPVVELPNVKTLITPMENWKSFPSDHTIASTLLTIFSWSITHSLTLVICIAVGALSVMAGRVYCGVHYPRDIIGGIFVALFSTAVLIFGFIFFQIFILGNVPTITN